MKQGGDTKLVATLVTAAILIVAGYFAYKYFLPMVNGVLPAPVASSQNTPAPNEPRLTEPKSGSKVASPLTIRGTVPPGWMFEGVFPIKLVDSNHKLIAQGQAKEEVPGSWQSNAPVYFTATLTFSTSSKSGFIVLENDNPSGDPSKSKTFEVPVAF